MCLPDTPWLHEPLQYSDLSEYVIDAVFECEACPSWIMKAILLHWLRCILPVNLTPILLMLMYMRLPIFTLWIDMPAIKKTGGSSMRMVESSLRMATPPQT